MSTPIPKPGILDISPYVGGESEIKGVERVIKLASNEGALGPSPKAQEAYREKAATQHRYPDGSASNIRKALAAAYGLDANRIVCGAGSDELLDMLARAYAAPGDEVMFSQYGFLMYPIAAMGVGATPVKVAEKNLHADVDALLERACDKTKILFLANPNNPTGTYLPDSEIRRLREGLPEHVLLVIDAAYAEYVTRDDYASGAQLVDEYDNVVMTRTFSKIFALSGIRLGWAYCPESVADILNRLRGPFNVASPALAAGEAALGDVAFTDEVRAHTAKWFDWTKEQLIGLGLEVPSVVGNFLLVRFPDSEKHTAKAADDFLKTKGIIVRGMAGYGLADCLRMTIGREDEMRPLVKAVEEFLSS
ncbi:MAG TPA: histidinol-phosphate transaminase [Rhodospirillales bacterium]|nr:histidinol-phosphate transaminase [Rhodospirillales bacterium]